MNTDSPRVFNPIFLNVATPKGWFFIWHSNVYISHWYTKSYNTRFYTDGYNKLHIIRWPPFTSPWLGVWCTCTQISLIVAPRAHSSVSANCICHTPRDWDYTRHYSPIWSFPGVILSREFSHHKLPQLNPTLTQHHFNHRINYKSFIV